MLEDVNDERFVVLFTKRIVLQIGDEYNYIYVQRKEQENKT